MNWFKTSFSIPILFQNMFYLQNHWFEMLLLLKSLKTFPRVLIAHLFVRFFSSWKISACVRGMVVVGSTTFLFAFCDCKSAVCTAQKITRQTAPSITTLQFIPLPNFILKRSWKNWDIQRDKIDLPPLGQNIPRRMI